MTILTLTLKRFRLFENETFTLHQRCNLILGANAQGKTTVLEAVHMLALGKSHRLSKDEDTIHIGEQAAHISASAHISGRPAQLSLGIGKDGKRIKFNQQEMRRLSDYVGRLKVVMFAPDDLDLVKGEPGSRRRFLDIEIGQLDQNYIRRLNRYRKRLKERNEILKALEHKGKYDHTTLEVVTERLAEAGAAVVRDRQHFVKRLNETLADIFPALSDNDPELAIAYHTTVAMSYIDELKRKEATDISLGMTTIGPHRDDLGITLGGRPARIAASQGQIRSIVLAFKLAVATLLQETTSDPPVILLDDVFSELDETRRTRLLNHLGEECQLLITSTDIAEEHRNLLGPHRVFTLERGTIKGVDNHG